MDKKKPSTSVKQLNSIVTQISKVFTHQEGAGGTDAAESALHVEELRLELHPQLLALLLQPEFVLPKEVDVFGRNAFARESVVKVVVVVAGVVAAKTHIQHLLQGHVF